MAKKNKKIKPVRTHESTLREDIRFFKDSVMFLLLCAVVLFTLRLGDFSRGFSKMTASWLPFNYGYVQLKFVFAVLTAAAIAFFVYRRVKKTDESMRYLSSLDLVCISGFCLLYCFTYGLDGSLVKLFVLTAVCGALYYICRFYNKDFVWFYLFNVILCYNFWSLFGAGVYGKPALTLILKAVGIAAVAAVLFFAYRAYKQSGKEGFIKWPYALSAALFIILAVMCAFTSFITPAYAMIVMLIQFIAVGVYYTVKILN